MHSRGIIKTPWCVFTNRTMGGKTQETCGRCSMTSVVDMTEEEGGGSRNPFEGDRIEVEESKLRSVMFPAVVLARGKRRLNEIATRLTYGDIN